MEVSIFLAKFWGLFILIVSIAFLFNKKTLDAALRLLDDRGFMLTTGFLSLMLGLATVIVHNVWSFDFRGLVTILGWSALLKGLGRFFYPELTPKIARSIKSDSGYNVALAIMFFVGAYLAFVGFSF